MRPLLHYARKLTLEPARMTQRDADAVFAAGWGEAELHADVAARTLTVRATTWFLRSKRLGDDMAATIRAG